MNCGGSIVSKNIVERKGHLLWCIREEPANELDNGWRFTSDIDDESFLSNPDNMVVCAWDTVVCLEPAVLGLVSFPVGTELVLERENGKKFFVDPNTGEEVKLY